MKILVVNAGSSSLKYQLIDMDTETVIAKGGCERIGIRGSNLKHKTSKGETLIEKDMPNHKVAIQLVLEALVNPEYGAIKSMDEIDAVGHRVVHSGEDFNCSVLLNDEVMKKCRANIELAPLHMPANILGIEAKPCPTNRWRSCSIRRSIPPCPRTHICMRSTTTIIRNTKSADTDSTAPATNTFRRKPSSTSERRQRIQRSSPAIWAEALPSVR